MAEGKEDQLNQEDVFSGIISHIVDDKEFYVFMNESATILSEMQEYLAENEPSQLFWYPAVNEIFLINISDDYFRAKRVVLEDKTVNDKEFMQALLIDIGEMVLVPMLNNLKAMDVFLSVPETFENVPPLAMRCEWREDTSFDKYEFLKSNLRSKILNFEKVKLKEDKIYVKILPYEEVYKNECDKIAAFISGNLEITDDHVDGNKKIFTKAEIDELYEEPLDTENALIATQGFATQDDERLCKFYNPKTGGCFKGSLCKKQHLPISSDGYECHDRKSVFMFKENFDKFQVNKHYIIKITFMNQANNFIFTIDDPDYGNKLEKIQAFVNDEKEIKTYKKIDFLPEIGQLVIAKIGGQFFRAKVYDYIKDDFIVWCLDDGSLKQAKTNTMYEWKMSFGDFEFLTHEMEISNIKPIKIYNKQAMMRVFDFDENAGPLRALITQAAPFFKCRLFDNNGNDIGKILIDEGYAAKTGIELCINYNSQQLLPI